MNCSYVVNQDTGEQILTAGRLAELLEQDLEYISVLSNSAIVHLDDCLCKVNVTRLVELAGWECTYSVEYLFDKPRAVRFIIPPLEKSVCRVQ